MAPNQPGTAAAQSESGRISGRMASWADERGYRGHEAANAEAGSHGKGGNASGGMISRMLVFESGAVYVASKGGDSILLEAHGECFTLVLANGTYRQHVTKYAPRCTHHMLKNAILFKNTHHTKVMPKGRNRTSTEYPPPLFCPDAFKLLGIPFRTAKQKQDLIVDGKQFSQGTDRLHWPKYTTYDKV